MCVLHPDQVKVLLPVRPFLGQRDVAEADLNPLGLAVLEQAGLPHVANVLISSYRARPEGAVLDRPEQVGFLAGFQAGGDQVTHRCLQVSGDIIRPPAKPLALSGFIAGLPCNES